MSLVLQLDQVRWQTHLTEFATGIDLVPVIKGNGYGLGFPKLVAEVNRLELKLIAVDTFAEATQLRNIWPHQILVMQPVRATDTYQVENLILTVDAHSPKVSAPVVVELKTKLQRFGVELDELNQFSDYEIIGYGVHLPIGETTNYLTAKEIAEALPDQTLFVSHLTKAELNQLPNARLRVGTSFWLGDRTALSMYGEVLEIRNISGKLGYGQVASANQIAVISGGTRHGIGMRAPTMPANTRQRLVALGLGFYEAIRKAKSPFYLNYRSLAFADTPHMNVSLLQLPKKHQLKVGDKVLVRARYTTTYPDFIVEI
jgi:hypothetical protein